MEGHFDLLEEHILGSNKGKYSQIYLEHALRPRNTGNLPGANAFAFAEGDDGNTMEIWLKVNDDTIERATFWTDGCGTTIACGSIATELIRGKTIMEALDLSTQDIEKVLGKLPDQGCTCAKLAVDAVKAAIRDFLNYKNEPWKRNYRRI